MCQVKQAQIVLVWPGPVEEVAEREVLGRKILRWEYGTDWVMGGVVGVGDVIEVEEVEAVTVVEEVVRVVDVIVGEVEEVV